MARFIDEIQARQTIEKFRASGLGVVQFAKREGISVGTFYRRRGKVDASTVAEPAVVRSTAAPAVRATGSPRVVGAPVAADPHLVPVVVRSTASRTTAVSSFEVELASGVKIRVTAGFDAAELVRLVEALAGVPC